MSRLSKLLRGTEGNGLMFWCPGCDGAHRITYGDGSGPHPCWTWNGDADKPTFTPSILVRGVDMTTKGHADYVAWVAAGGQYGNGEPFEHIKTVCHSFVTDGRIQFLSDCTHAMAGQIVDLPPFNESDEGDQ